MPSLPDSAEIDRALVSMLLADTALQALMPDGVYIDQAAPNAQRFVIVSLADQEDVPKYGDPNVPGSSVAYESALYLVKAVALGSDTDADAAAARIRHVLEDQVLTQGSPVGVPGYTWMTCHREGRVVMTEVDAQDPNVRWEHRGGHYRVDMSVG
ncbi:MAG: hypothetical protein V4597_08570 [Pseudomonadota bacterium]